MFNLNGRNSNGKGEDHDIINSLLYVKIYC